MIKPGKASWFTDQWIQEINHLLPLVTITVPDVCSSKALGGALELCATKLEYSITVKKKTKTKTKKNPMYKNTLKIVVLFNLRLLRLRECS